MDDLKDDEKSFIEGLPDVNELCSGEGFVYEDMSFPQWSDSNSELNDTITDVREPTPLTETSPYTDGERSFLHVLPDVNELCSDDDDEFRYRDLSFPQCSGSNSELNDEGSAVNEPAALSETNSSSPTKTLGGALDWVIDCYADRGLLEQPLDNARRLDGQNSEASPHACLPVSSMQDDGCVNDSSNDSESPACSMQSNRHVDQNDTPNASESPGPLSQYGGGGTSRDAEPSVISRPVFGNIEMRQSLVLPPIGGEADFGVYFQGLMNNVHNMRAHAFARAEREDIIQIELRGEELRFNVSAILNGPDDNLDDFEEGLFKAMQSNIMVMAEGNMELVVQIVQAPRGGGSG
ncbi:uncharacterized protein LOC117555742 [Gymnodraco acuticeps]|uniref:Uncharacterized protein LOC117555742 n=1 Tax=Gymnodraco acuticeps TaxID=8218 RepID=A0A6P8V9C1_GYMAC|nr:uncharacterized protein LOC117555742 [Gymnodraco acuticeps]